MTSTLTGWHGRGNNVVRERLVEVIRRRKLTGTEPVRAELLRAFGNRPDLGDRPTVTEDDHRLTSLDALEVAG